MKTLGSLRHRLSTLNKRYLALPPAIRIVISTMIICLVVVGTQDFQIFPGAFFTPGPRRTQAKNLLPENVESITVQTTDNEKLETWRFPVANSKYVAIIFHGNAGDVANFFVYQKFFASLGITSYGFDYRGFGISTGWPSEQGLNKDTEAVLDYVKTREQLTPDRLILVGVSIGAGPASYGATLVNPKILLLMAPFVSLPEAIKTVPLFGWLAPLTFYEFPVAKNVEQLKNTCLIVTHGVDDTIIPIAQGREVAARHSPPELTRFLEVEGGGHNDTLPKDHQRIAEAIRSCLKI